MGVVIPPWISEDWFQQCPFNYCDHFGDYLELAKVCRICKEAVQEGRRNSDYLESFEAAAASYAVVQKENDIEVRRALTYLRGNSQGVDDMAEGYSIIVEGMMNEVLRLYRFRRTDKELLFNAFDILAHSERFVVSKLKRALWSEKRERKNSIYRELADSKTSALFAYMAVDRNARAVYRLSSLKITPFLKDRFLEFSKLSDQVDDLIKKKFFPEHGIDKLEEFGCDSYKKLFPKNPGA